MSRVRKLHETQRFSPRWGMAMGIASSALVLSFVLPRLETHFFPGSRSSMSVNAATAIFSSIASGMMALTGVVFSLAFVMIQFGATAYSPRLVGWMANSRVMSYSLGIFTATFLYSLGALAWVDRAGSGSVPLLSTWFVVGLLLLSLRAFMQLIRSVGMMEISTVLYFIGEVGWSVLEESYPGVLVAGEDAAPVAPTRPASGAPSRVVKFHGQPKVLQRLDLAKLTELATAAQARLVFEVAVGDTVADDIALARVELEPRSITDEQLLRCMTFGVERTFEQDPKYAFRLLVDIAIKSLSAAINDPTTAVQALDQVEGLLRALGRRKLDVGSWFDADGHLRVVVPVPSWEDFLILACEETRFCGATSIQVMRRLGALLADLADEVPPSRRIMVKAYQNRLDAAIQRNFPDAFDQRDARAEDRQGLGMTREHHAPLDS